MEHFYICFPREQGSLKGPYCRVLAPLTLAYALLCSFLPGINVHSIMLICVSRFLTAARSSCLCHPTLQLKTFLSLNWQHKSCKGKAAHQPHLVLHTRDCAWCPASTSFAGGSLPFHTVHAQLRLTWFILPHHLLFQMHLSVTWKNQHKRGDDLCDT